MTVTVRLRRSRRSTHGHTAKGWVSPTYKSWQAMKSRCLNENDKDWMRYGGSGVSVCDRWMEFVNFLDDMGERPDGTTLDRIDSTGDYEPGNCRWADPKVQGRHNAEKTHCVNGHEFTPENTYIRPGKEAGKRTCRTCNRALALARYHARKAAR